MNSASISTVVSFVAAVRIQGSDTSAGRRGWMTAAIAIDLCVLGFFKYYNFFAATIHSLIPAIAPPLVNVILPIGISFYTFHTISYVVDVAVGRVRATRNLFEYFTYVSLFSQLVAGPIVRYRQIEDDLEHIDAAPREDYIARGIGFFVVGLLKKAAIADPIAELINPMLASYDTLSLTGAWSAALGYTLQLYFDFSGYSDMAVGLGYMFGIRIPQNFNAPYCALGISDFWRRWHMSLSSWLRDYLYIPLGGNRLGVARTNVNLGVTMLLGGRWHGANWTIVVWGAYHGFLLILERAFSSSVAVWPSAFRRALTFLLVVIGWVVFRAQSMRMAFEWLGKLAGVGVGADGPPVALIWWAGAGLIAVNVVPETWDFRFGTRRRWGLVYALGMLVAYCFMNGRQTVFLYYQF